MATFWQDIRYGVRWLAKSPGFAFTVIISLALGIGATTAAFSVIRAVILNPFPYRAADRIVSVLTHDNAGNAGLLDKTIRSSSNCEKQML